MSQQNARGDEFHKELQQYSPGSKGGDIVHGGGWGFHNNPVSQMIRHFNGADDRDRFRNATLHQNMARLGYGPANIGVQANPDSE